MSARSLQYGLFQHINSLLMRWRVVLTPSLYGMKRTAKVALDQYAQDYIRYATWELIAEEIEQRGIPGSVAELGVYRGRSAKLMNELFSTRKLYLYDTFAGFDERDLEVERRENFSGGESEFRDAPVEAVLSRMPHRDKCIVRQGYFPETAVDTEEQFAFVSIDVDLYQPIYEGLKFFYPRLVKGGYLFVHDYNHQKFQGAAAAVRRFSDEFAATYLPIPDTAGSAVFIK